MGTVITDTSAIYALVDADDARHSAAVDFVRQEGDQLLMVVTDATLFEALTLIKSRLGQKIAARTLSALRTSSRYRLIHLTEQDLVETWRIFEQYADKEWSPFDCACLAAARIRNIGEAFAFDRHFDQMATAGLTRRP